MSNPHPIASGFAVGEKSLITAANVLIPYADKPGILRVHFPCANRNFCAEEIKFHPKFEKMAVKHLLQEGLLLSSAEIATMDFNCCLVTYGNKMTTLYETDLEQVQEELRFPLRSDDSDLRGSLKELELPLVIQTLTNARKQGILYLFDEQSRPVAQIFCSDGKVISSRFGVLTGELALYQILEKRTISTFQFYPSARGTSWPTQLISGSTDMILIEGMRRVDEIGKLKQRFGIDDHVYLEKTLALPNQDENPNLKQAVAKSLWQLIDGSISIGDLWLMAKVDDFAIYNAVCELLHRQLISLVRADKPGDQKLESDLKSEVKALDISRSLELSYESGTVVESLSIGTDNDAIRLKSGAIVSSAPGVYCHNITLEPKSIGSPLMTDGVTLGMHLGALPETNSSQLFYKFLPSPMLFEFLQQSNLGGRKSKHELTERSVTKPMRRRSPKATGWKMTLIWFILGFAIVLSIKHLWAMLWH